MTPSIHMKLNRKLTDCTVRLAANLKKKISEISKENTHGQQAD